MTTKERLYRLVDALPERERETAAHVLEGLAALAITDPVARALALAPDDDEPETDEERAAVAEARAEFAAGRGISSEQLRRQLGL